MDAVHHPVRTAVAQKLGDPGEAVGRRWAGRRRRRAGSARRCPRGEAARPRPGPAGRRPRTARSVSRRAAARSSSAVADAHRRYRPASASATIGWTSPLTSPPNRATSRTRLELRYVRSRAGTRNTVSRVGMQPPVHQRHLELVLEVAHRAEAAHHHRRPDSLGELGQQPFERLERHPRLVAHRGPQHVEPLVHRKERLLRRVDRHGDDHPVRQREAPPDQVLVTLRRRIERAGVDRDACHGAWQKVRAVSP